MSDTSANSRGITLMAVAMACYALNDALVKSTLHHFPAGQVLAVRGAMATVIAVALAWRSFASTYRGIESSCGTHGACAAWAAWRQPIVALRCGLEVTTAVTSVLALAHAPLALVGALMMTAPLMIAGASMAFGWEPVRLGRIAAVVLGFAGTLGVLQPGASGFSGGALWGLACAVSLVFRDLVTRRLPAALPSSQILVVTTLVVCLAGFAIGVAVDAPWSPLGHAETLALMGAACCAALGNYALIAACRTADLSAVTPFRYTLILWGTLLGFVIWGDVPDLLAFAGMGAIIVAGLINLRMSR